MAVGDAVGTTLEFKPPGAFKPITDMVGGGPFNLKPGQWTDDTSMALCLATSLVETGGFDPKDQMDRYRRWANEGYLSSTGTCFDIGQTIAAALRRYRQTGDPIAGSTNPYSAVNGCIMRLAPVHMFYFSNPTEAIEKSAASSRTTHGATACLDACRYFAALLIGAFSGCARRKFYHRATHPFAATGTTSRLSRRSTKSRAVRSSAKTRRKYREAATWSARSRLLSGAFIGPRVLKRHLEGRKLG